MSPLPSLPAGLTGRWLISSVLLDPKWEKKKSLVTSARMFVAVRPASEAKPRMQLSLPDQDTKSGHTEAEDGLLRASYNKCKLKVIK